jgi:MoaA/NifB/PqqE/SkfB family radical SAM enzyme
MINYHDIRDVHLEISTLCNASCPWCPRNFWGYPYNNGYPETNLSLDSAKKIFHPQFLRQLTTIRINGNLGDIVMNPEGADIVEFFRNHNPEMIIKINTNGSARNKDFWTRLANARTQVLFALDGLEDTHYLYRQNTVYKQILKNAKTFIQAGGQAVWQMIQFDHNKHQIDTCRRLSQEMGFTEFIIIDGRRDKAPVFDAQGRLSHIIGDYKGETNFQVLFYKKKTDDLIANDILDINETSNKIIDCEAKKGKSIYVTATGDVFPCCYMGFYPKTFGKGQYYQPVNKQIQDLMHSNNALENSLEECISWFSAVESSWKISTVAQGRLIICNDKCGT